MRLLAAVAGAALIVSTIALAQSPAPQAGMQAPQIISAKTDWPIHQHCGKKQLDWARVSLDVAEDGTPQSVELNDASQPNMNDTAIEAVQADRFAPAERDGKPVKVHGIMLVEVHTCAGKEKQPDGTKQKESWMVEAPKQSFWPSPAQPAMGPRAIPSRRGNAYRIGNKVSAPVPIVQPAAEFTNQARKDGVQGEVMISLTVDADGMPQNPLVVKPLPAGLTEAAIAAVRKYRFRPALKDGTTPVPTMITIAVNFTLY
jgi:TonB family protein